MARKITLNAVETMRLMSPKRRRFSDNPIVKIRPDGSGVVGTIFGCIDSLFEAETGIMTQSGPYGPYCYLTTEALIDKAMTWQEERQDLIFLRDNLQMSVALDFNLQSPGTYTALGQAEHDAKADHDEKSVTLLANEMHSTIDLLMPFREADAICPVPPSPDKAWDLPSEIVKKVSAATGKPSLAGNVGFKKPKGSVKSVALSDKWYALDEADLAVDGAISGKKIILIDDKYQSGTTMQYVASKLIEGGASHVYGLCALKTWRDTDNT